MSVAFWRVLLSAVQRLQPCSAFVTRLNRHLFSHIKACDAADLFFYMHGIPASKKGCAMWAWLRIASASLMPVMLKKLRSM